MRVRKGEAASKGEVWLLLNGLGHIVADVRHLPHDKEDECVIEFILATPVEVDAEAGGDEKSKDVFRLEGSHELSEVRKYSDETKGDDVLVIMPGEKKYAIVPRRQFHETPQTPATTLRSDIAKYIQ